MTEKELREKYNAAYRIIKRERVWRERLFARHYQRDEKLAEMDRLLEIVDWMKDQLKDHLEPEYEQPRLLDVGSPIGARRAEYE